MTAEKQEHLWIQETKPTKAKRGFILRIVLLSFLSQPTATVLHISKICLEKAKYSFFISAQFIKTISQLFSLIVSISHYIIILLLIRRTLELDLL